MTVANNSQTAQGGGSTPSYNELEILQIMGKVQNHNMEQISKLASLQLDFESVQEKAALASKSKVDANASKLKKLSRLSLVMGILGAVASGLSTVGMTVGTSGASSESFLSGFKSFASTLGNAVLPVAEGATVAVQAKTTISVADNSAAANIAGSTMKGLDEATKEAASTYSSTIESSSQVTSKEQSIISDEKNSKMYH